MSEEKKENEATEVDLEASLEGPAYFSNKFTVSIGPAVRIAFMETGGHEKPHFRTAVAMHPQDAIELYKLLKRMLGGLEVQLEEMMASSKDGEKDNEG